MRALWQKIGRGISDVIFPRQCVHCRALVEESAGDAPAFRHVCLRCAALLDVVHWPHCTTCGHPFHGIVEGERICPHCEGLEPAFGEGRTATLFKGAARALVIELKYHQGWHVLDDMMAIFRHAPDLLDWIRGATLVPVPLHPRKARERGYNQAGLLAEGLAREAGGGTVVKSLLRRVVDSASQTAFDRRTRMTNLKNAFALARGGALNPHDHFILVDDVFTTGSTLNSCARALRRAGGVRIDVVTFGHG
jgi:ComF family protein